MLHSKMAIQLNFSRLFTELNNPKASESSKDSTMVKGRGNLSKGSQPALQTRSAYE